jgi:hypothetical protein
VGALDALPGDQGVDAVLERRAHLGEHDPLTQQVALVAQLPRRHIRLGQQVGAQQMRQCARVDGVGLHPRGGDRLGPERVGQVQLVAVVLEQVGEPLPAVGRLERDLGLAVEPAEQRHERVGVVGDPAREQLAAVLVERRHVRALAMQVDADRIHPRASFDPDFKLRPRHSASDTGAPGGPLLHGIKACSLVAGWRIVMEGGD